MFPSLMDEEEIPKRRRNTSCWKRGTQLEKCLIILFILAIIALIATTTLLLLKPSSSCVTPGCIKAAATVVDNVDTNVNPCNDFYKFVCGKYIENTVIPDDKTSLTTFTVLTDQLQERLRTVLAEPIEDNESTPIKLVKNYYRACVNKTSIARYGLQILKEILREAGGWPVLDDEKWREQDFDWKELMYKFKKIGLETAPFIELGVGTDLKNSSSRCIHLDQPEFGLSKEFLLKGINDTLVIAYSNYMVDIAVELGCNRSKAQAELSESLEFEIKLAELTMPKEERRNISKLYNIMSIDELQANYPGVPWLKFINKMLTAEVQVDGSEKLTLVSPQYVTSMIKLLNQTSKRVQANYGVWRTIKQQISYLSDDMRQLQLKYMHEMSGITEQQIRWKECVEEVSSSLPILASAVYIRKYFNEDAKKDAVQMVEYIKESFKSILKSLDWMDKVTLKSALDKADAVVHHTGYPDELLDDKKLEEYYRTLEVYPDQYLKSHLNIQIHTSTFAYNRLRQPVNKTDWVDHGSVAQVNAFYHPLENSIMFPAGILQGPFFNQDRPRYMNYAAIGSVIGHELTHGFDDTGKQFDKDGNLMDWWASQTEHSFLQKAQCIIYQYGNYTNKSSNGINTQGENIADNGGIKEAYLAYRTWVKNNGAELKLPGLHYTPNQLFWISGAMNWCAHYRPEVIPVLIATDSHSLNEFRVLGPFSNLKYFAEDFHCPVGSKMNPKDKCSVW